MRKSIKFGAKVASESHEFDGLTEMCF